MYSFFLSLFRSHCEEGEARRGNPALFWIASLALAMTVVAAPAQAEIYFWQDPGSKVSVTVPDTWAMVHNQKPDDVMTFVAPSDGAMPMCRMRVRGDKRFVIYPQRYSANIQHLYYSDEFWQDYAGEFAQATVENDHDDAGLGRGFGSFAQISYKPDALPMMPRKAVAFASLYRDKAYILECSAEESAYNAWLPAFLSMAKSVEFRNEIGQMPGGMYMPLHHAPAVGITNRRKVDKYYGHGLPPG